MNVFKDDDTFDLASALYFWLQHNWDGITDDLYADFCRLTEPGVYKPSHSEEFFDNIEPSANDIYDTLNRENYRQALELVLNYEIEDKIYG